MIYRSWPVSVIVLTKLLDFCFGTVLHLHVFFQRAERTSGDANTLAVDADNLKVHVLTTLGGDVGVTAGVAEDGALSAQLANAGHRSGVRIGS